MINIEELTFTRKQVKNLRFLRTMNNWKVVKNTKAQYDEKMPTVQQIKKRVHNRYLKISCPEDYYIKIPDIKGEKIFYTTSSDDNFKNENLCIYSNKPNVFYIELNNGLVGMEDCSQLTKKFIVNVLSNSNDRVEKYGIVLVLEYKNNGTIGNPNYSIETYAGIHSFDDTSVLYNTIDITFFALFIYQLAKWFSIKKVDISEFGYGEVAILIA